MSTQFLDLFCSSVSFSCSLFSPHPSRKAIRRYGRKKHLSVLQTFLRWKKHGDHPDSGHGLWGEPVGLQCRSMVCIKFHCMEVSVHCSVFSEFDCVLAREPPLALSRLCLLSWRSWAAKVGRPRSGSHGLIKATIQDPNPNYKLESTDKKIPEQGRYFLELHWSREKAQTPFKVAE